MLLRRPIRLFVSLVLLGLVTPVGSRAQDFDIGAIFSNDQFFQDNAIVRVRGDVGFVADLWALPPTDGRSRALVGVSLSNSSLQFERTSDGLWQANYRVEAAFQPENGETVEESWDKSLEVGSFDESLLTSETIVFQTEVPLDPGAYEVVLIVHDLNNRKAARATTSVDIPDPLTTPTLSEPVLLRLYQTRDTGTDYVVSPSHYYSSAPDRFDFMVEVVNVASERPYTVRADLIPEAEAAGEASEPWTSTITAREDGSAQVFGSLSNESARFGEFLFRVDLVDADGETVATRETPLLISGSGGWIAENWDDALSLIRWEATDREMDILRDVESHEDRVAAWNCFWRMRDPVEATATNEALIDYFQRIAIANQQWRSALRPGFLSDRGRVFVTLGAPDDVVERPVPAGSDAFEVWTYYRYNFQIVFVDRIGFNNYQLESVSTYQRELATIERRKRRFLNERADLCPLLKPAYE